MTAVMVFNMVYNFSTVFSPLLFLRHYNNCYWLLASNHLTSNLPLFWTSPDSSLSKLWSLSSYSLSKTSLCARQRKVIETLMFLISPQQVRKIFQTVICHIQWTCWNSFHTTPRVTTVDPSLSVTPRQPLTRSIPSRIHKIIKSSWILCSLLHDTPVTCYFYYNFCRHVMSLAWYSCYKTYSLLFGEFPIFGVQTR